MAHKYSVDEIAKQIGVDSLAYISVDGLYRATKAQNRNNKAPQYCDACFTGEYMSPLTDYENKKTGAKVTQLRERAKN